MSNRPYRALRIILGIFSLFTAAAGLLLVFSGKPLLMRLLLRPPETEVSTLLLFLMKELGGLALMLSLLFFFATRDPVRNVAIVNGLIVGLCILARAQRALALCVVSSRGSPLAIVRILDSAGVLIDASRRGV